MGEKFKVSWNSDSGHHEKVFVEYGMAWGLSKSLLCSVMVSDVQMTKC